MAPVIRTNFGVARWIAIQTIFAMACVVPATALSVWWMYGGDFSRPIDGYFALRFSLALAAAQTALFCPIVAYRSIAVLRDLNIARDELEKLSLTDQLTGLFNRRGFDRAASVALAAAGALGRPVAALMCDIDHFKKINDEFGHEFGDAALRQFAELLRTVVAGDDIVLGRQGGEEFVVLLLGYERRDALALAERLRKACAERSVEMNGESVSISVSIGLAATPSCDGQVRALVARADSALYEAKRDGRNRVVARGALPEAA